MITDTSCLLIYCFQLEFANILKLTMFFKNWKLPSRPTYYKHIYTIIYIEDGMFKIAFVIILDIRPKQPVMS